MEIKGYKRMNINSKALIAPIITAILSNTSIKCRSKSRQQII